MFVKSCSGDSFCYALSLHVCPDFLTFYLKLYPVLSGQENQSQHELPPTLNWKLFNHRVESHTTVLLVILHIILFARQTNIIVTNWQCQWVIKCAINSNLLLLDLSAQWCILLHWYTRQCSCLQGLFSHNSWVFFLSCYVGKPSKTHQVKRKRAGTERNSFVWHKSVFWLDTTRI